MVLPEAKSEEDGLDFLVELTIRLSEAIYRFVQLATSICPIMKTWRLIHIDLLFQISIEKGAFHIELKCYEFFFRRYVQNCSQTFES